MIFAGIFNLSGGEIVFILTLTLMLIVAKFLPELTKSMRKGFEQIKKHASGTTGSADILKWVTFVLAAVTLLIFLNQVAHWIVPWRTAETAMRH